jgi:hypothetical protein
MSYRELPGNPKNGHPGFLRRGFGLEDSLPTMQKKRRHGIMEIVR